MFPEPQSFVAREGNGRDRWETWTPVRTGWTDVGTPTVAGRFRVVGRQCFFQVLVTPATSVATTAGTSYIGLPIGAEGYGGDVNMANTVTLAAVGSGMIDVTNSRCYVPTQGATGNPLAICGWYEV
jgi:hypothetical protein